MKAPTTPPPLPMMQARVLACVLAYQKKYGIPPSEREVARRLRRSHTGVRNRLEILIAKGYLSRHHGRIVVPPQKELGNGRARRHARPAR